MIDAITIILGILVLISILWTVLFVLMFRQIKRMTAAFESFFDNIQRDLVPLITDLSNASQKISQLSQNLDGKLNQTNELFEAIKHMGEIVDSASGLIRDGMASTTTYVRSAAAGFRAGFDFLSKHIGKGGGKHGE